MSCRRAVGTATGCDLPIKGNTGIVSSKLSKQLMMILVPLSRNAVGPSACMDPDLSEALVSLCRLGTGGAHGVSDVRVKRSGFVDD